MKNRLCIFSYFDKDGFVDDYVIYVLEELLSCVDKIVVVVNGKLDERGKCLMLKYAGELYIRENVGYDAGGYKHVLCQRMSMEELMSYDEIILCNDTFFGPFIPMKDIFERMESKECDVWGLNGYTDYVFAHIQSFFLVFRERVIREKLLINYFEKYIDENTYNINHIYCQFENGLFDYLTRENGMKYAIYVNNRGYDVYEYSYAYLKELEFPIVKKKTFSFIGTRWENIICSLSYVKNNTNYDIELILKYIQRVFRVQIKKSEIPDEIPHMPPEVMLQMESCSTSEIEAFIENEKFYIYGAGNYGCNTYWRYAKDKKNFQGFIISDEQKKNEESLFGHPVFYFSEVKDIHCCKIVLAMRSELTDKVLENFSDTSRVLRIF